MQASWRKLSGTDLSEKEIMKFRKILGKFSRLGYEMFAAVFIACNFVALNSLQYADVLSRNCPLTYPLAAVICCCLEDAQCSKNNNTIKSIIQTSRHFTEMPKHFQ